MSSNYPGVPPQFASSFDTLTRVTTTLETQGKLHSIRPPRSISAYNEILNYQLLPYHAAIVWNKSWLCWNYIEPIFVHWYFQWIIINSRIILTIIFPFILLLY